MTSNDANQTDTIKTDGNLVLAKKLRKTPLLVLICAAFLLPAGLGHAEKDSNVVEVAATATRNALGGSKVGTFKPQCRTMRETPVGKNTRKEGQVRRIRYEVECTTLDRARIGSVSYCIVNLTITADGKPGMITTGRVEYVYRAACEIENRGGRILRGVASKRIVAE